MVNPLSLLLQVFGIQFYGECWSGTGGDKTYGEYGWSRNCWQGVGGPHTNFVYEFVDDKKVRLITRRLAKTFGFLS